MYARPKIISDTRTILFPKITSGDFDCFVWLNLETVWGKVKREEDRREWEEEHRHYLSLLRSLQ